MFSVINLYLYGIKPLFLLQLKLNAHYIFLCNFNHRARRIIENRNYMEKHGFKAKTA